MSEEPIAVELAPWPTATLCVTCAAASQLALPAWLALITQLPTPMKETTPPLIEQTELAELSIVKATGMSGGSLYPRR